MAEAIPFSDLSALISDLSVLITSQKAAKRGGDIDSRDHRDHRRHIYAWEFHMEPIVLYQSAMYNMTFCVHVHVLLSMVIVPYIHATNHACTSVQYAGCHGFESRLRQLLFFSGKKNCLQV